MEQQRQYVGIDLHRRRSVIVRMAADGTVLGQTRIDHDAVALAAALADAGSAPEVVMEATLGGTGPPTSWRSAGAPAPGPPPWDQGLRLSAGEEG